MSPFPSLHFTDIQNRPVTSEFMNTCHHNETTPWLTRDCHHNVNEAYSRVTDPPAKSPSYGYRQREHGGFLNANWLAEFLGKRRKEQLCYRDLNCYWRFLHFTYHLIKILLWYWGKYIAYRIRNNTSAICSLKRWHVFVLASKVIVKSHCRTIPTAGRQQWWGQRSQPKNMSTVYLVGKWRRFGVPTRNRRPASRMRDLQRSTQWKSHNYNGLKYDTVWGV